MAESVTVKVNVDLSAVAAAEARVAALQQQALGLSGVGGGLVGGLSGAVAALMNQPRLVAWNEGLKSIRLVGSRGRRGIVTGGASILSENFANQIDDVITHLYAPEDIIKVNEKTGGWIVDPKLTPLSGDFGKWVDLTKHTPGFTGTSISPQIAGINSFRHNLPPGTRTSTPGSKWGDPDDWFMGQQLGGPNDGGIPPGFDPRRNIRGRIINPGSIIASGARGAWNRFKAPSIFGSLVVALALKPLQAITNNYEKILAENPGRKPEHIYREAQINTIHDASELSQTLIASPVSLFYEAASGLGMIMHNSGLFGDMSNDIKITMAKSAQLNADLKRISWKHQRQVMANAGQFRANSMHWNAEFADAVKEIPDRIESNLQSIHSRLESTGFRVERFLVDREFKEATERKVRDRFADEQERLRPKYTQSEGIRSGGNR